MIALPKGTGPDPGGLVRYSFGRGKANEHTLQRTVAGNCHAIDEGQVTREAVDQVANDLRINQQIWGDQSKKGHVYHVVISLNPGDRPRTDAEWKAIAEDYMTARGITDPKRAGVKWTAVNHGLNEAGADHVHIIASLIRDDGTKVSTWQDQPRSKEWAIGAEDRHGLIVTETRKAGVGGVGYTKGEHAKAKDNGREPTRVRLADVVRPIAAASSSELDYVQRLREAGLDPKPRVDHGNGRVTGYSVALDGERFGGGSISPELKLPALRRTSWDQSNTRAAAQEWAHPTPRRPAPKLAGDALVRGRLAQLRGDAPVSTMVDTSAKFAEVSNALDQVLVDAQRAPDMTPAEHRAWSAQASGLTAAAAAGTTDPVVKRELQMASRDLARWAGPTDHRPPKHSRNALQVLAAAVGSKDHNDVMDAADDVGRIVKMHKASRSGIADQPRPPIPIAQQTVAPSVAPTPVPVQPAAVRPVVRRQPAVRFRR